MAEIVNLRTARKRAERNKNARQTDANRMAHGTSRHQRQVDAASRDKAARDLDGHKRGGGDNNK